jgi:hypothetical protein
MQIEKIQHFCDLFVNKDLKLSVRIFWQDGSPSRCSFLTKTNVYTSVY